MTGARKSATGAILLVACLAGLLGAVNLTAPGAPGPSPTRAQTRTAGGAPEGAPLIRPAMPRSGRGAVQSGPAAVAVPGSADIGPRTTELAGWVIGDAPGHGAAWAVEAYRLTPERAAVLECRRAHVSPDGRLHLEDLEPGLWQTALVTPRFAWGPLVDTSADAAPLRLGDDRTSQLLVSTVADGAAPTAVPLRLSLTAVRSPALAGAPVSIQRRLPGRGMILGEAATLDGVSAGTYEVTATVLGDPPGWGDRPRSQCALVTVGPGATHVALTFDDPAFAPLVAATGRATKGD